MFVMSPFLCLPRNWAHVVRRYENRRRQLRRVKFPGPATLLIGRRLGAHVSCNNLDSSSWLLSTVSSQTQREIEMVVAVTAAEADANTCYRGCCSSSSIPLRLPSSTFSLLSPIAKGTSPSDLNMLTNFRSAFTRLELIGRFRMHELGAESTVFEARLLDGTRVAAKKPVLSTSDDLDRFHRQLQLLWSKQSHVFN